MTIFRYKAIDADGKIVHGEAEAADVQAVLRWLRASGRLPIDAEQKSETPLLRRVVLRLIPRRDRVRHAEITALTQELATLLRAGIPLDAALRTLERHAADSGRIKAVIQQIHDAVQSGKSLSDAMAAHGDVFDPLYVSLIRAGEAGGALADTISSLAVHREQVDAFRSTVLSALTYPALLAAVASGSLLVLLTFVVPRFMPLFAESGETLPLLTEAVFAVARALQMSWWTLPLLPITAKLVADRWLAIEGNRLRLDELILRAPLVGKVALQVETVRFTRTLGTLLGNGLPLVASLKLVRDVQQNSVFTRLIDESIVGLRSGYRLVDVLERQAVLPDLAIQFLRVGEEAGRLEEMLERTADAYETRAQQQLKRMLTLLEPALILGLGAVIGVVIVSILLAMLGMSDLVA